MRRWTSLAQTILFYGQIAGLGYTILQQCYARFVHGELHQRLHWAVLSLSCFALWALARIQLGGRLTFFAEARGRLVKTGLYRYFRHPIYYFGTLGLLSYFCLSENYKMLWLLLLIVPMQVVRAMRERKVLRDHFDDEYSAYERSLLF